MAADTATRTLLNRFDRWLAPALAVVALTLLLAETARPLRRRTRPRPERWRRNAGLALPSLPGLRLALLPAMVGLAGWGRRRGLGLHRLPLPPLLRLGLEVLVLDYVAYTWHRLLHAPLLWRFHQVHHLDLDMDLTTAWRFHAGEMLASVPYRGLLPALVGVRPETVLAYEAVFEACTAFHHSNLRLPFALEKGLVHLLVTPRAHGIHHSQLERETNSNFGVVLSCWDRLHRTLRLNVPQQHLTMGVPAYPLADEQTVVRLLQMPWQTPRPWPPHAMQRRPANAPATELLP